MSEPGVTGNPAVFAPAAVFKSWNGKAPPPPKSFVGIMKGNGPLAFHDPELTFVYPHRAGVVFLQQIAASTNVKRYLKKLPAAGWKPQPGTYTSDGGEHMLFDAMYAAADYGDREQRDDIEAESGRPTRVELAKGEYRLEVLGIWKPDDDTELVAARLVPSSSPLPSPEPKKANEPPNKEAKRSRPEIELEYVAGHFPPPLPPLDAASPAFLKYLHDQEAAMLATKQPMVPWEKEWKAIANGKRRFTPADADAVASTMLPIDFGKQPHSPDRSRVKTKKQWNQQNREFQALSDQRFVRDRLWCLIVEFISKDPTLKRGWKKHAKAVKDVYGKPWFDF